MRTRGQSLRNGILLFGTAVAVSVGIGIWVDTAVDPGVTSPADATATRCRIERADLIDALNRTYAQYGRYLDIEGMLLVGQLDRAADDHVVVVSGPTGAEDRFTIVESETCARNND
jgi:hypothetical protein